MESFFPGKRLHCFGMRVSRSHIVSYSFTVNLSICLSVRPSVHPSVYLPTCLPACLPTMSIGVLQVNFQHLTLRCPWDGDLSHARFSVVFADRQTDRQTGRQAGIQTDRPTDQTDQTDKTRQDKTRQDKTRQDKTRQDKTRQDKTRQDKTDRPTGRLAARHVQICSSRSQWQHMGQQLSNNSWPPLSPRSCFWRWSGNGRCQPSTPCGETLLERWSKAWRNGRD